MNKYSSKKVLLCKFSQLFEGIEIKEFQPSKPGINQVAVRLLKAPINPSDLGVITGSYGNLPQLPAVLGREGVGEIYAFGEGVSSEYLGRRVKMPLGSWQDSVITDITELIFIPEDIPINMAAMAFINPPTAWCLLHNFVLLQPGDWIVQNAANSAVGMWVIQLARHFGFRTINIVRDLFWKKSLKDIGADYVFKENSGWEKKSECQSLAKLALNSIGGESAIHLIRALAPEGVHVTFGGMTKDPIIWPTRDLIFKNITVKGFALDKIRFSNPNLYLEILDNIYAFIRKGMIDIPVEKSYPLDNVKEALAHASKYHRKGKILLESIWSPE